jgi:MscS family membrane protein
MTELLAFEIAGGISIGDALTVLVAVVVGFGFSTVFDLMFKRLARRMRQGSLAQGVMLALDGPVRWAIFVAAVWAGVVFVLQKHPDDEITGVQWSWFFTSELPFVVWFGTKLVDVLTGFWLERAEKTDSTFDDQLVPVVRTGAKAALFILGTLLIIQNMGGEVGSLLAGVGIGGVAVAMAAKDTIANLFGSIVIFVDRPFMVGDWVEIGDQEGTVEEVGLRVTRIRTFENSQITVPNSQLTTTAINNWSRMQKRRVKLFIGVTYDANAEQLEQAVEALRDVLRNDDRIDQSFWVVNFTNFGASSLDIMIYCFTTTTRWAEYLQVRQELFFEFMKAIERLGLDFAFPTQTVHLEMPGDPRPDVRA